MTDAEPTQTVASAVVELHCQNEQCDLYHLKLEPDEVAPVPGNVPDRCAACGQPLSTLHDE